MAKNNIDLAKKYSIEKVSIFLQFDDIKYKHALGIPQIQERLLNACSFAGKVAVEENHNYQCGLVRASISELVSLEELRDVRVHNNNEPFRLHATEHPLLCIVKELRNLQMHLSSVELDGYKRELLWGRPDKPEGATAVTKDIYFVNNLVISEFANLRNYKHYDPIQVEEALIWFDSEQREWGITELLIQASYIYAESLSNMIKSKS